MSSVSHLLFFGDLFVLGDDAISMDDFRLVPVVVFLPISPLDVHPRQIKDNSLDLSSDRGHKCIRFICFIVDDKNAFSNTSIFRRKALLFTIDQSPLPDLIFF